jgi:hypothetical protein
MLFSNPYRSYEFWDSTGRGRCVVAASGSEHKEAAAKWVRALIVELFRS